jgi:hypothetical protein
LIKSIWRNWHTIEVECCHTKLNDWLPEAV